MEAGPVEEPPPPHAAVTAASNAVAASRTLTSSYSQAQFGWFSPGRAWPDGSDQASARDQPIRPGHDERDHQEPDRHDHDPECKVPWRPGPHCCGKRDERTD